MPPGKSSKSTSKRVRLSDVAAHVGVSRTTVASVLLKSAGKNARVGEETAKRIRKAADELGYCPNAAAQRLAGKRSRLIGTIIDSYAPVPHFRQLSALERAANDRGYRIMIGQSHGELEKIRDYARDFVANGVDGVICISHDYPQVGMKIAGAFHSIPHVVFLGQPLSMPDDAAWVAINHRGTTADLTRYLLDKGRRNLRLCLADLAYQSNIERRDGFLDAMQEAGLDSDDESILVWDSEDFRWDGHVDTAQVASSLKRLLAAGPVDAILANNDFMAMHIIRALNDLGRSVPEDVSVAGYDNMPLTEVTCPSVTTVELRDGDIARNGFALLLDLMDGKELAPDQRRQKLRGRVIPRESA